MNYFNKILFFFLVLATSFGCGQNNQNVENSIQKDTKETLRDINKALVDKDREMIDAYIERHQLNGMQDNGSGLYYLVWGEIIGPQAKEGSVVVFDFTVSLLDGTQCYSSKGDKPKDFLVGYGGVESGLEMAMKLMHQGQKGKFILPPHLAHGLLGDNKKIPPRSIIVYDVHLLNVIDK